MKKKRVKYLALREDISYLEEEYELYDIIIQDCSDLFIDFYDYIYKKY